MAETRRVNFMAIAPLLIATALIGAVFLPGLFRDDPDALPSSQEGRPAPAIEEIALGAFDTFTREDLEADGLKLVNFWASWCAPCRVEHPHLKALAEEMPVYGINRDTDVAAAAAFLAELGDPFTGIVHDTRNAQSLEWGVFGLPETYLIDGDGTVILHFRGPITERFLERDFRPAIEAAGG